MFYLTVTPYKDKNFQAFTVRPYVRENLNVGSDIIDVKSMQENHPHLAADQDFYHVIRALEYFAADEWC